MKTCSDVRMHLMDYAWQRLSAAEAGAVEHHLAGCPDCRAVLDQERTLGEKLAAVPVATPSRDLWQSVRARQMALDIAAPEKPSPRLLAPVIAERVRAAQAWQRWSAALTTGVAVLALMLIPGRPARTPVPGAQVLAQTLDTAGQVARQSDDPMAEVSDTTWDVLSAAVGDNTTTPAEEASS